MTDFDDSVGRMQTLMVGVYIILRHCYGACHTTTSSCRSKQKSSKNTQSVYLSAKI